MSDTEDYEDFDKVDNFEGFEDYEDVTDIRDILDFPVREEKQPTPPQIEFLPLGAIIQSFVVGDTNIVLNFPEQSDYQAYNSAHFGETIGRVANRVANAQIDSLNNRSYILAKNNGDHSIHGGVVGWGKRIWDGPMPVDLRPMDGVPGFESGKSFVFTLRSEDGDEGYPGTVLAKVYYTVSTYFEYERQVTVLGIEYEAELAEDDMSEVEETVVNMTNHSYFNLAGNSSIHGTFVSLCTHKFLGVGEDGIPVQMTPTTSPYLGRAGRRFMLEAKLPIIDGCFLVRPKSEDSIPLDTRRCKLRLLVSADHPASKIHLLVFSTEPAFQFYTGDYIDVPATAGSPARGPRSGFCVEPSRYVDAVNRDKWKNQVVLKKGMKYGSRIVYKAWQDS